MARDMRRGKRPRQGDQSQQDRQVIPLPDDTTRIFGHCRDQCHNLGLLLDCFVPWHQEHGDWKLEGKHKYQWFSALTSRKWDIGDLVKGNWDRWRAMVEATGARQNVTWFTATTDWRMVSGLGGGHVLETALTLHRIYGFPIIPGSALKGMTRAWVELEVKPDPDLVVAVFGSPPSETPLKAGQVIFFDAVPTRTPKLEPDVMNPHYGDYYGRKTDRGQPVPPADYLNPVPVYFLAVAGGCEFGFAVAPRDGKADLAKTAAGWLKEALREMGVGAKTAAGYGYWEANSR